jgi:hypothetical protein
MKRNLPKPKITKVRDYHLSSIDSMPLFKAANHSNPKIAQHPKVLQAIEATRTFIAARDDTVQLALSKAKARRSLKPKPTQSSKKDGVNSPHLDFYKALTSGRARHLPDEIIFAHLNQKLNEKKSLTAGEALDTILTAYKKFGFSDAKDALIHLYQFVHTNPNIVAQITTEERKEIEREQQRVSTLKKERQQLNLSPKTLLAYNIQTYTERFEELTKTKPKNRDALIHGILMTIKALENRGKRGA